MDNELLLVDRIGVIRDTITKYGEENFYLSFSGGKDSTILHYLLDMALPNNRIPRVFINTGIEYNLIVDFVKGLVEKDDRFVILKPTQPIKPLLEKYGYPFKSKEHSLYVQQYQKNGISKTTNRYLNPNEKRKEFGCPKMLRYQFSKDFELKVSNLCCFKLKKEPIHKWEKETNRHIAITGMRKDEGGNRKNIKGCILTDKNGNIKRFHPLLVVSDEWENWVVKEKQIKLCDLYLPPYNFKRTGCKLCPFSLDLQHQMEIMEKYFPNELKQAEWIWKPVFDEYRRIGFRLKGYIQTKLDI